MYDAIVHPADGSSCADEALEHAISLAKQYDAELHLVYVIREPAVPPTPSLGKALEELEDSGNDILSRRRDQAQSAGVDSVTTHLEDGPVAEQILGVVEDTDADVIAMGTHGRSGLERYMLGSVAERILRQSPVPVLAVGPTDEE